MLPPIAAFPDPKQILRERMKGERKNAARSRPDAAKHAARQFIDSIPMQDGATVALYYPIGDELDTEPLLDALLERDFNIALPVMKKKSDPLTFRAFAPGDPLIKAAHGVLEPDQPAETVSPTIVMTPLLAFTRRGDRLGYGGGYYDRTLERLRKAGDILAVGYGFGVQEVDAIPVSRLDQPLDWVVTEREAIKC